MATNKLLDRLDREYEVYALKKQLDEVFRRFVDPDTFESRQPSEIEEMLEEFKKTLPKAVAEVLLLWLEVEYWPLEDAVCRILFVDPEAAPQTYAYVCRWLKADIKSNKIDAEEVGGQLCLTASPLIEWALNLDTFPK